MLKKRRSQRSDKSDLILDLRPSKSSKPRGFLSKTQRKVVLGLSAVVIILVLLISIQRHKPSDSKELAEAKAHIGKLMLLPVDEEPTLAAVTDKNAIKDPFIAKKSENGDQLLIYSKNRVVIIYRPSANKIVTMGDFFADPALPESEGATITVFDGSKNSNKTRDLITKITALYPKLTVIDGGETNKKDFPKTVVIDNTNKKDNLVDALVSSLGGNRGVVPVSESRSDSDLMIIVGKD